MAGHKFYPRSYCHQPCFEQQYFFIAGTKIALLTYDIFHKLLTMSVFRELAEMVCPY